MALDTDGFEKWLLRQARYGNLERCFFSLSVVHGLFLLAIQERSTRLFIFAGRRCGLH